MVLEADCTNDSIKYIGGIIQMKDLTDLLIALFVILFFGFYFINYDSYCSYRNHNKIREVQIKEKKQANFYDADKIKNGIKDKMFILAFMHILFVVACYSFIENRIGDNLFFSTGLVFSGVILLTGMIVKKLVIIETWNREYQYMIPKDIEMSKQEKFNTIMSEQEQKNVFIVAAIACALMSWTLCSPKLSCMFLAVLVGGIVWFETNIKKTALEICGIVISFINNWNRLLIFLVPTVITHLASRKAKEYIADNHAGNCIYIIVFNFFTTYIIWDCIIGLEAQRKHNLDREWRKIQEQQNSRRKEGT